MASIYNRATPSQRRVLRIIEGAIKNACDAHPHQHVDTKFARSIAKRAAGTLSGCWPEVLAAQMPSDRAASKLGKDSPASSYPPKAREGGRLSSRSRSPLRQIHTRLGLMAGWARKAGHESRAAAFADALRVIASVDAETRP